MKTLEFRIIKTQAQYDSYCDTLEELVAQEDQDSQDKIELLTLLIEKWDQEHTTFEDSDPIMLIKSLMEEKSLKPKDLGDILELSKGTISKILNYHKGLSKDTIRKLSEYFKLNQEAFNRPYRLMNAENKQAVLQESPVEYQKKHD
jgi:HTH-type transcriptional regulator/antitoxin HigA